MTDYTFDSYVRACGYYVYEDVWTASLACQAEFDNVVDPYAVAVVSSSNITVGHVPRAISSVCYTFLRRHGTIECVCQLDIGSISYLISEFFHLKIGV